MYFKKLIFKIIQFYEGIHNYVLKTKIKIHWSYRKHSEIKKSVKYFRQDNLNTAFL